MSCKKWFMKRAISGLLAFALFLSVASFSPMTVHAAGWLGYAQNLTLGQAVTGSIKSGDYNGLTEGNGNRPGGINSYWHIYRFSMPKDGLLNIYLESTSSEYLNYNYNWQSLSYFNGFTIFSASDPDHLIWRSMYKENVIDRTFSSSRGVYYGSTEISLSQGEYYFAVRQYKTNDAPYYLTLSYKEPVINVTSISLNLSKMTMEVGDQRTISASVVPSNATDKTVIWKSSNPSVATVNGGIVKAVSNGKTTIIASSADGEVSAPCEVTVACIHVYQQTVYPANTKSNGRIVTRCIKCGNESSVPIYAIQNVSLSKTSYVYNGKVRKPSVTVQSRAGVTLKAGTDYTVSYPSGRKNVGEYTVTVTFKGNYKGTVKKTFKILPQSTSLSSLKPGKGKFTVKWKKQTAQVTGYEISYSTSSKFTKKTTNTVLVGKNKTVSKKISGLKNGKTYYVKIRTYKNVKVNGKTKKIYSGWSKVKRVTINK